MWKGAGRVEEEAPDDEEEVEEPLPAELVAPGAKEEGTDDWEEVVNNALVNTELGDGILKTGVSSFYQNMKAAT